MLRFWTLLRLLRTVRYNWKDERKNDIPELGVLAQEVEPYLPDLVSEMTLDDEVRQDGEPEVIKTLSYDRMVAPIVKSIQDLKHEKDDDVAALKAENEAKDARIALLESQNKDMMLRLAALEEHTGYAPRR